MTQIKFLGQSCFEILFNGKILLFDPFISGNPKIENFDLNSLKPDYILLSHGHTDHVLDAEKIAKMSDAKIISNYEIITWYGNKNIPGHPLNHGGQFSFDFGNVKYVNAVHSSVLPDGTYGGNPGGFVINSSESCFYFAGDTALTWDMKLIPLCSPRLDFAILPIGDNFTMGIDDAVMASEFINCNKIIGCHFDTFGYIEINHEEAKSKFAKAGKELIILEIEETIEL